jgi:ribose-phosphate pyrophosphokinase
MSLASSAQFSLWSPSRTRGHGLKTEHLPLFALGSSRTIAEAVARVLGIELAQLEEREFEDGEHKVRPLTPVRGRNVYVLHSLYGEPGQSANDKLCRLLFFINTLKDAGATCVTAVVPYLCYARKDRRTKANDPLTSRYVGTLLEAAGADLVLSLDVHNPAAFENAFRRPTVALTAIPLFVEYALELKPSPLCVISPDPGGVKRAELFREALEGASGQPVGKGFVDKHRSSGVVSGTLLVGEVKDATALVIDDLLSTGGTLQRAARAARAAGARRVVALVTHALFMTGAQEALADPAIDRIVITDAVPPSRLEDARVAAKLDVLPCAPLLGEAICRLHQGGATEDLLVF